MNPNMMTQEELHKRAAMLDKQRYSAHSYKCVTCGAKGVKLWRYYNVLLSDQRLTCLDCTKKETGDGLHGDQVGSRIPAAPDEFPDKDWELPTSATYWGYTSVPDDKVAWWRALPPDLRELR